MAADIKGKVCSCCKEEKPLIDFGESPAYKGGRRAQCNPCRAFKQRCYIDRSPEIRESLRRKRKPLAKDSLRRQKLRVKYGITPEQFDEILTGQGGVCAICGTDRPGGKHNAFCVDHCHETGKVRGILCYLCNVALGRIGDSYESAKRFLDYLRDG